MAIGKGARRGTRGKAQASRRERRGWPAPAALRATDSFPLPDRYSQCGLCVGEICFECECRILEIGGPDGLVLAWCECPWPEEHHEMEIVSGS